MLRLTRRAWGGDRSREPPVCRQRIQAIRAGLGRVRLMPFSPFCSRELRTASVSTHGMKSPQQQGICFVKLSVLHFLGGVFCFILFYNFFCIS